MIGIFFTLVTAFYPVRRPNFLGGLILLYIANSEICWKLWQDFNRWWDYTRVSTVLIKALNIIFRSYPSSVDEIHESSRCGHQDVTPFFDLSQLMSDTDTSVRHAGIQHGGMSEFACLKIDLVGKLPGWGDDDGLRFLGLAEGTAL